MRDSNKNKLGNKIAKIICIPFIIIGGGFFIYHELFIMGKDIQGCIPLIFMFLLMCGIYALLKKGFASITIKVAVIIIAALLLFLFN